MLVVVVLSLVQVVRREGVGRVSRRTSFLMVRLRRRGALDARMPAEALDHIDRFGSLPRGRRRLPRRALGGTVEGHPVMCFDYEIDNYDPDADDGPHSLAGAMASLGHDVGIIEASGVVFELDYPVAMMVATPSGPSRKPARHARTKLPPPESFDEAYRIQAVDHAWALWFLSPEIRSLLAAHAWFTLELAQRHLLLHADGPMSANEFEAALDLGVRLLAAVPPDLVDEMRLRDEAKTRWVGQIPTLDADEEGRFA